MIFANEGRHHVRIEQLLGQAVDGAPLEVDVVDCPAVRADGRPALAKAATTPAGLSHDRIGVAAQSADAKPGQQLGRAPRLFPRFVGEFGELLLDRLPQIIIDNLEVRHRVEGPFFAWPRADAGFAGARVDQLLCAADDELTIVEPVAQDPVLPRPAAGERVDLPELAARRGYAVPVQIFRDLSRRSARCIFGKDPHDDRSRVRIDFPKAVDSSAAFVELENLAIAVGDAGGRKPLRRAAALGAADVVSEILALLFVEQSLYAAGQGVDFAISEGEDPCAGEVDTLADMVSVPLVAGDAAGAVRQNLLDAATLDQLEHVEHAGALRFVNAGAAADRIVAKDVDDRPAFGLAPLAAHGDLIVDRPAILKIA